MLNHDLRNFLHSPGDLVVLVSDEYPPETGFGGIGSYTWNMGRGLARQGCRVMVISRGLQASSTVVDGEVAVVRFSFVAWWQRGLLKLFRLLRLERSVRTLLFAWCVFWQIRQVRKLSAVLAIEGPEWNAPLLFVGLLTKWPYALRIHTPLAKIAELDHLPKTLDVRWCLHMEALAVSRASAVLYASDVSLADSQRFWSLDTQQLVKLPLPVDTRLFAAEHQQRAAQPLLIFVGRLEPKKGVELLVEALPQVFRKVKRVRCLIIGPDGLDELGGSMQQRLASMVAASGLAGSVEFLGGIAYDKLPDYLDRGWVLANPSEFESFGMTCLEAVACGCRVVVGRQVGFAEWMKPDLGAVMKNRQKDDLAEQLVSCLLTKPRVDQEYVEQTFGLEAVARQTVEIYKSISNSDGQSG
jgi:glycosyltransferase involved in cell wall biosynthesis